MVTLLASILTLMTVLDWEIEGKALAAVIFKE